MKNDADYIRNLLLWLLQTFVGKSYPGSTCNPSGPTFSLPSGNGSTSEANSNKVSDYEVGSDATSMKPPYQQGSEEVPEISSSYPSTCASALLQDIFREDLFRGAVQPSFSAASRDVSPVDTCSQTAQSFNFGEIHAVQERFQALIKQRLLSEYENNPPLFPWESEVSEYPAEVTDYIPAAAAATTQSLLWSAHVSALKVPSLLPAALMNTLFARCQEIVASPIKQGVRLVRAVEDLFPESADMLEPIANMVLVPAYRSGGASIDADKDVIIQELANAVGGYSSAMPEQQVALSMLAAQEILGALTLSVSADRPFEKRSWVTTVGVLELTVGYKNDQLSVVAVLPEGGQVRLCGGDVEKQAVRSQPGSLDLIWVKPTLEKNYVLEVSLQGEAHALSFVIQVANAGSSPYLASSL